MGRPRTIESERVLEAARRVVSREGAVRLTLDAVAVEAGISKASVLYDYKTKQALIRALVEREVEGAQQRIRELQAELGEDEDAVIRGRLAFASQAASNEDRMVAVGLCAALSQESDLRVPVKQAYGAAITDVIGTSTSPRGAMLAFLAIEGLLLTDLLDLHVWPDDMRARLIDDIAWLIGQRPPGGKDAAQP